MLTRKLTRTFRNLLLPLTNSHVTTRPSSSHSHPFHHFQPQNLNSSPSLKLFPLFNISSPYHSHYSTTTTLATKQQSAESNEEVEPIDIWEEEDDETEPKIGDGGVGGGVVLQNCPWGEKALTIARDVLLQFGDDIEIFAFKTSPGGYIYVRLDRLCNEYGCPGMEDILSFNHEYKKRLDEAGAAGDIPDDLALEVSSPGADRLLRIPDDLERFKDMAMRVKYVEQDVPKSPAKEGIFYLEAIEAESGSCEWRLADVKENRDPLAKGRPMTRKQKDWRLKLPYEMLEQVTLYLK